MANKHSDELELVRRLFKALHFEQFVLDPRDRPDVVATIGGRSIGIEVTVFHADESENRQGSLLRAAEEKTAKKRSGNPYATWGVSNPLPGLKVRIAEKVAIATEYETKQSEELWLLIVAQLPKPGAVVATFAFPEFLNPNSMNEHLNDILKTSPFSRVYLHLLLDRTLCAWSRSTGWCRLTASQLLSGESEESVRSFVCEAYHVDRKEHVCQSQSGRCRRPTLPRKRRYWPRYRRSCLISWSRGR